MTPDDLSTQQSDGQRRRAALDDQTITMRLLEVIAQDGSMSQRRIASELGIALGLANAYVKKCIRKGLLKITQVPARRYAYYLTLKGAAEKTRLTAEFLSQSFQLFRIAREQFSELLHLCAMRGWRRIAIAGCNDLTEICFLCTNEAGVTLVGIIDPRQTGHKVLGLTVVQELGDLPSVDAVIITEMATPHHTYRALAAHVPEGRILAPPLLGSLRTSAMDEDDVP